MEKKKGFKNVIDDLLETEEPKNVRPEQLPERRTKGRPRMEEYERRTFQVRKELYNKLKMIAAKEGILQKDILEYVLREAVQRYEKTHGVLEPHPIEAGDIGELFK